MDLFTSRRAVLCLFSTKQLSLFLLLNLILVSGVFANNHKDIKPIKETSYFAYGSYSLMNSTIDQLVKPIVDGETLVLDEVGRYLNIKAEPSVAVGSVVFESSDGYVTTDNVVPFSYRGDSSSNYYHWQPSAGNLSITIKYYTGASGSGTLLGTDILNLNIVQSNNPPTDTSVACQKSNTFKNDDGGGVHIFDYSDVKSAKIDFDFVNNSFQVHINDAPIHNSILEAESALVTAGDVLFVFASDNEALGSPWLPNDFGLPRVRINIAETGIITFSGTRETTSNILEPLKLSDNSAFNTINFTATSNIKVTNIDEGYLDGIAGKITITENCTGGGNGNTSSLWTETDTNIHFNSGNVGIGTSTPGTWKLAVNGNIRAKEIKVETANWPDYVFSKDYDLPSLAEIQKHIQEKGHLPGMPSATEAETNGVELGEMNRLLLEKVEELTLFIINQKKEYQIQARKIEKLEQLEKRIAVLESNQKNIK